MSVRKSILIFVIVAASLCFYSNALLGDFVLDDNVFIASNPYMKSFGHLPKFFVQDFWKVGAQPIKLGYYRPMLAASFMLDYLIWHLNPLGYHLTNIILHILASILMFLFV
ncbi:hypothetical protein ACFL2J_07475, partial [Candidatus Omnitrophota bacterium]